MDIAEKYLPLYEKTLRKVFFETYDEVPEQFSKYMKVENSKKRKETDYHVAGLGMWDEHDTAVEYESHEPGPEVVYEHKQFSKGVIIDWVTAEDDLNRRNGVLAA